MKKLNFTRLTEKEMLKRSRDFKELMLKRKTVRDFSSEDVDFEIIENCIQTAGSAPSGVNKQPWHFVLISNPEVKRKIRPAAEAEEKKFYESKAPEEWLKDLQPLGTGTSKPFLETAPYLIVIFAEKYKKENGKTIKNYYVKESVGIATGFLIAALHNAGLAVLTYTPSPMEFLNEILGMPSNEKPFIVLTVGYPSEDAQVPDISKKKLDEILIRLK